MPAHIDKDPILPKEALKQSLENSEIASAFLAGFMASGEGFNGEYLSGIDNTFDEYEAWFRVFPAYLKWLEQK